MTEDRGHRTEGRGRRVFLLFLLSSVYCLLSTVYCFPAEQWVPYTNFTSGELSPLMEGRVDMQKYHSGCSVLQNMVVYPHGPATKRSGFEYIAEVKNSSQYTRLVPFEFSTTQAYALEFGQTSGGTGYMRVYKDGGQLLAGGAGSAPYEIATPYNAGDLHRLRFCQSADVMYLVHPTYDVRKLARTGHTSWTLSSMSGASQFTSDPFVGVTSYPSCCTWHEDRLVFANTNSDPTTMWLSKSGDYEDFTTGVNDDDAIIVALASDQVNAIRWLSSAVYLTMGTTAGEWRMSAVDPDDPITPTNITAKRELIYGSADAAAVQIGKDMLFIQRFGKKIRKLAYNWESGGYVAPDMSVLSEHLTESGVSEIAYQKEPFSVLWAVAKDGSLLGLTYMPEHEVYAWHRHTTRGLFESVAVIPGTVQDDLYAVVNRTNGAGGTSRFVERLTPPFNGTSPWAVFHVDAGITYEGAAATHLTGATHLRLMPVVALADGVVRTGLTVDAIGGVTLPVAASQVHLGLAYTATLKTLRLEAQDDGGSSQGRIKRVSHAIVRVLKTPSFSIGPDDANMLEVNTGVSLFTGDKKVGLKGGYNTDGYVQIRQENPLPMTIRAIMSHVETGD